VPACNTAALPVSNLSTPMFKPTPMFTPGGRNGSFSVRLSSDAPSYEPEPVRNGDNANYGHHVMAAFKVLIARKVNEDAAPRQHAAVPDVRRAGVVDAGACRQATHGARERCRRSTSRSGCRCRSTLRIHTWAG
jgi:hypothetical protein